jgi:hypothetical protein
VPTFERTENSQINNLMMHFKLFQKQETKPEDEEK